MYKIEPDKTKNPIKEILLIIGVIAIVAIIFIGLPIIAYTLNFGNYNISDKPESWGVFGDFMGGSVGALLGFLALTISFISVYYTVRTNLELNNQNIQILKIQNTALPYIDIETEPFTITIKIQNQGLGIMIVDDIYFFRDVPNDELEKLELNHLKDKYEYYENGFDIMETKLQFLKNRGMNIFANTANHHIIGANNEKIIFKAFLEEDDDKVEDVHKNYFIKMKEELSKYHLYIIGKDIFEIKRSAITNLNFVHETFI